jgi:iron complex outermembrane receptor protein
LTDKIKTSSIALADTLAFAQDSVLLTLGARNQTIQQDSFAYNTSAQIANYNQSRTSPVAGLVVKPSSDISLYANYIEGLVQGGTAPVTFAGQPVTNGGQSQAPFNAKQKEIGAKYDGGTFGASVALFTTAQPLAYVQNQVYGTYGEQRNQGLELSVYGEAARGLRLLGGLTLIKAKQTRTQDGQNDGKDAIGVPRQQLNIGAEWDLASVRGLSLNARVINTSKQYANASNTQQLASWTRLDAGARYLMEAGNGKVLTWRARIDNLLNKSYWASTGGAGSNYLVLGAPRTLVVSASVDF